MDYIRFSNFTERQIYERKQKESGLKVGDKVIITRRADSYENGWGVGWVKEMDRLIGAECTIIKIDSEAGMYLGDRYDMWNFPYFVLKKVNPFSLPKHLFEI